jgi:hypothetical protein
MNRIMAPFAAPTKALGLQGKSRRVRGSVSFGAAMDSPAFREPPKTLDLPGRGTPLT